MENTYDRQQHHSGGSESSMELHFTLEGSTEMAYPIEDSAEEGELIAFMESTCGFRWQYVDAWWSEHTLILDKYVPTPAVPLVGIDWIIRTR